MINNLHPNTICCPVCKSCSTLPLIEIEQLPVQCHLQWTTEEGALSVTRGDIHLYFCRQCAHLFNAAFQSEKVAYTQDYENSLHFSPRFQAYAFGLVEQLIQRYNLRGKNIVEIGCGRGDFLAMLCALGDSRGIGFDPSSSLLERANGRVRFVRESFSERFDHYPMDMVVSRHVLEHIPDPVGFLSMIRRVIGNRRDTVIFLEVPNAICILRELAIWDLIYEHCSYFTILSIREALRRAGFNILNESQVFDGQFLTIEALPDSSTSQSIGWQGSRSILEIDPQEVQQTAATFVQKRSQKLDAWRQKLGQLVAGGQRVVIWGAGSKGVMFLNLLDTRGVIEYAVDINPRKEGMFVAGTAQRIVSPELLLRYRPDVVITMNPAYAGEIRAALRDLGLDPELLVA